MQRQHQLRRGIRVGQVFRAQQRGILGMLGDIQRPFEGGDVGQVMMAGQIGQGGEEGGKARAVEMQDR